MDNVRVGVSYLTFIPSLNSNPSLKFFFSFVRYVFDEYNLRPIQLHVYNLKLFCKHEQLICHCQEIRVKSKEAINIQNSHRFIMHFVRHFMQMLLHMKNIKIQIPNRFVKHGVNRALKSNVTFCYR